MIATTSSAAKAERFKALGAAAVVNYVETPDWHEIVAELTDGRGADCVVEIGGPGTLTNSIKALAVGGHISLIGSSLSRSGIMEAGRKRTHWMWFAFPQLRGLGHSSMATFYGFASLHEARAYLGHPLLGPRLDLCTRIVLELEAGSLHEIFGSPDDMKFQSSMTAARQSG